MICQDIGGHVKEIWISAGWVGGTGLPLESIKGRLYIKSRVHNKTDALYLCWFSRSDIQQYVLEFRFYLGGGWGGYSNEFNALTSNSQQHEACLSQHSSFSKSFPAPAQLFVHTLMYIMCQRAGEPGNVVTNLSCHNTHRNCAASGWRSCLTHRRWHNHPERWLSAGLWRLPTALGSVSSSTFGILPMKSVASVAMTTIHPCIHGYHVHRLKLKFE